MSRKNPTAAQREAHRKANREYAARKKKKRDHAAEWSKVKQKRNETRRAKYERDWQRNRRTYLRAMIGIFGDLIDTASLVSENALKRDATRWRGPGARREARLEAQADAILRKASRETPPPKKSEERKPESAPPERVPPEGPTLREQITDRWIRRMRL
jgi:hypothetical protein